MVPGISYLSAIRKLFPKVSKVWVVANDDGYTKLSMREIDSASSTRSIVSRCEPEESMLEKTEEANPRRAEWTRNVTASDDLITTSPPAGGLNTKGLGMVVW